MEENNISIKGDVKNTLLVVGHAYGKPGTGSFNNSSFYNFFKNNYNDQKQSLYIALTGDFVRVPDKKNLTEVKSFLENNSIEYYLALGNHDIESSIYKSIFEKEIYYKEFQNFLLISANFSNKNWLPTDKDQETIQKLINNSQKDTVVLLSHQIFWANEFPNEIEPNSWDLLETKLKSDSMGWLSKKSKKFIVISGDHGAFGAPSFCSIKNNTLYIANGLGDKVEDSIIKITDYSLGFSLEEVFTNEN